MKKNLSIFFLFSTSAIFANPIVNIPAEEYNLDRGWETGFAKLLTVFFLFIPLVVIEYIIAAQLVNKKLKWDSTIFWIVLLINSISYPVTIYFSMLFIVDFNISVYLAEIFPLVIETTFWTSIFLIFRNKFKIPVNKAFGYAAAIALLTNIGSFSLSGILPIMEHF